MRLACTFYDGDLAKIGNDGDGWFFNGENGSLLILPRLAGHE